jgi:glycosyl hydrolase family 65
MHRRGDAFTAGQKSRNFAHYERLTVRDSSLSACTQAVIAAETGHLRLAYDYLAEAALMDLDDLEHNTGDGLHMAALAGSWMALVAGLAGMRNQDGTLSFAPRLPEGLTRLAFKICLRQRVLAVDVRAATATYTLLDGEPLRIMHHGQPVTASFNDPVRRPIPQHPMRLRRWRNLPDVRRAGGPPRRPPSTRQAGNCPGYHGRLQLPAKGEPRLPGADPRHDLVPQLLTGPRLGHHDSRPPGPQHKPPAVLVRT